MSETSSSRRVLHLVVEGFPPYHLQEIVKTSDRAGDGAEIFQLTETSAQEALEKIFAADTVAVWGDVSPTRT